MLSWAGMESSQRVLSRVPLTCDPTGCSLPGSSVRGILQARTLEWGILSQASNLHLLHWQAVLYHHVPWDTPDSRILLPLPQLSRRRACAHASQVEARFLAALLMASLVSKPPKGLVFLVSDSKAGTHSVVHTLSPEDGTQAPVPPLSCVPPIAPPPQVHVGPSPSQARLFSVGTASRVAVVVCSWGDVSSVLLLSRSPRPRKEEMLAAHSACDVRAPQFLPGHKEPRPTQSSQLVFCSVINSQTERQKEQPCVSFLCPFGGQELLLRFEERLSNYQLCFISVHYFFDFL